MKYKYFKYILFIFLFIHPSYIKADGISYMSLPPSPDAAALGKYGQYPVTLYNGLVNIEVPIYTIKLRQFELPISLSYHASGIKVDEISSCVGLGWALQAGGVITRSVKSRPDDKFGQGPSGMIRFDQEATRSLNDDDRAAYLSQIYTSKMEGGVDIESDVYYYNVAGMNGSFRFDMNGNLVQIPLTNNKIEYDGTYFTITRDDGTIYGFNNVETSIFKSGGTQTKYVSSWYLSYIITKDKQEIDFGYQLDDTYYLDSYVTYCLVTPHSTPYAQQLGITHENWVVDNTLLLKNIKYPGGTVEFVYNGDRKDRRKYRLNKIDVTNNTSFVLEQSYFDNNSCQRLKLDKVKLQTRAGSDIGQYCFDYNTSVNLPPYLSSSDTYSAHEVGSKRLYFGQDSWGYYNGVTTNQNFLTYQIAQMISYQEPQADRTVNSMFTEANCLKKITYPTGGSTVFIYEGNKDFSGKSLGGLRIKNIISYKGDDTPSMIRSYEYRGVLKIK